MHGQTSGCSKKQQRLIEELNAKVASHETRVAELKITPYGGSYILHRVNDVPHAGFNGGFVLLQLRIDNSGLRNSVVDQYQVEIGELGTSFTHLQPEEGRHAIRGRHCDHGLNPNSILSETGIVRIDAENATRRGELIFFLPGLSLNQFVDAGLRMTGDERRFGTFRCRLTVTDTAGSSANAEFELHEA